MDKDIQSDVISTWTQKDNLEQALMAGIHGVVEFKHDEKVYYLGGFKENVLMLLSQQQVAEVAIYPEVIEALQDKRATKMIINGNINISFIEKYKKIAEKMNKPYTVRSDPEFKGTTGLLVVSDEAIDIQVVTVQDRSQRLKGLGLSSTLINLVGKKVCKECLKQIVEADPKEAVNYHELTFLDRIGGESCPAHQVTD